MKWIPTSWDLPKATIPSGVKVSIHRTFLQWTSLLIIFVNVFWPRISEIERVDTEEINIVEDTGNPDEAATQTADANDAATETMDANGAVAVDTADQ